MSGLVSVEELEGLLAQMRSAARRELLSEVIALVHDGAVASKAQYDYEVEEKGGPPLAGKMIRLGITAEVWKKAEERIVERICQEVMNGDGSVRP